MCTLRDVNYTETWTLTYIGDFVPSAGVNNVSNLEIKNILNVTIVKALEIKDVPLNISLNYRVIFKSVYLTETQKSVSKQIGKVENYSKWIFWILKIDAYVYNVVKSRVLCAIVQNL